LKEGIRKKKYQFKELAKKKPNKKQQIKRLVINGIFQGQQEIS
jgi:hypothetical protein